MPGIRFGAPLPSLLCRLSSAQSPPRACPPSRARPRPPSLAPAPAPVPAHASHLLTPAPAPASLPSPLPRSSRRALQHPFCSLSQSPSRRAGSSSRASSFLLVRLRPPPPSLPPSPPKTGWSCFGLRLGISSLPAPSLPDEVPSRLHLSLLSMHLHVSSTPPDPFLPLRLPFSSCSPFPSRAATVAPGGLGRRPSARPSAPHFSSALSRATLSPPDAPKAVTETRTSGDEEGDGADRGGEEGRGGVQGAVGGGLGRLRVRACVRSRGEFARRNLFRDVESFDGASARRVAWVGALAGDGATGEGPQSAWPRLAIGGGGRGRAAGAKGATKENCRTRTRDDTGAGETAWNERREWEGGGGRGGGRLVRRRGPERDNQERFQGGLREGQPGAVPRGTPRGTPKTAPRRGP